MLLQLILRKRRRGVSPVIAMLLVITLALAGGAVIIAILNSNLDFFASNTDQNVTLGSQFNSTSGIVEPSINVTGIERDPNLVSVGSDDYVKIAVQVTNLDFNPIYIMDIDVSVYGQKLDDISPWSITSATGNSVYTSQNGQFAGYQQQSGKTATYIVEVHDSSNSQARIPANSSFVYEVLYGSQPNVISASIAKEKQAEVIFAPVFYKVAIIDYGSTFGPSTAAGQFENTMKTLNATNKVFFLFNRTLDSYDYSVNPGVVNGTYIAQTYDIVIVDTWAVPAAISSQLQIIHANQISLIFYGSVSKLGATRAAIATAIDYTATEQIIGVTPLMYPGTPTVHITDHSYTFGSGSSVLSGLENANFQETEDDTYITSQFYQDSIWNWLNTAVCGTQPSDALTGIGDGLGVDIANFTNAPNFNSYGVTSFKFYDQNAVEQPFSGTIQTTLLTENYNNTAYGFNKSLVFSFIWKENNNINPNAILVDTAQLSQIRINMLGQMAAASDRVISTNSGVTLDSFSVYADAGTGFFGFLRKNRFFDVRVTGTVVNSDIKNGELSFSVNMPDYAFHDCTPSYGDATLVPNTFGSFSINGQTVVQDQIIVLIGSDNIVNVDIGDYYKQDILVGSSFALELGAPGTWMFAIDPNTTILDWGVTIKTSSGFSTSDTFQRAVDANGDNAAPNAITDLAATATTSGTIDLTWTQPYDNVGVTRYAVERNGVIIDSNVLSTSFTDNGLSPGTTYGYRVFAYDAVGLSSPASNQVNATTLTGTPPPDVTGLQVDKVGVTQIDLSWAPIANINEYWVFVNDVGPSIVATSATPYFNSTGLLPDTSYNFRVYAMNNSILSTTAATLVQKSAPPPSVAVFFSQISVTYQRFGSIFNRYYVPTVTFTLDSNVTSPLANAQVIIDITYSAASTSNYTTTLSGTTNANGQISITFDQIHLSNGEGFTVSVTGVITPAGVWDIAQGVYYLNDTNGNQGGNNTNP